MPSGNDDAMRTARAEVVGRTITGARFVHGHVELHVDDLVLTGLTEPFGMLGCAGVGPASLRVLIGRTVEEFSVESFRSGDGEYLALDSGECRLAFPIGGPTATGPESVRLARPARPELGLEPALWIW